ncbi:hypothetical protein B0T25DRAFT_550624 [Lasiosphaeria hispida]|uniref:Protein kinase domain-containing protein n=1 Tax=Lasiosphaeria hispida TaxID=260671 RepID=A0AAJ0HAU0_9PEZI|nr:hypothetical protein B0T25DRAFT_550624 [Lasiosphaeria hispida]
MLHTTKFHLLVQAIGNLETLPSLSEVQSARRTLSPTPRRDEQDIRAFIRAHAELPAADIVSIYLEEHPDPRTTGFEFRNNAYGIDANPLITHGEDQPPPAKRRSPDKSTTLAPDRWGIRTNPGDTQATALIGEYKAAHKARAWRFQNVLGDNAHPADTLFTDCVGHLEARRKGQLPGHTASVSQDQTTVARVLCQAYHYMITSGLLYAYVSSGGCMIFLNIKGTHHGDLYFHFVPCSLDLEGQQPTAELVRSTPAAQLTTLSLLALEAETKSPGWIDKALGDLSRWPSAKTIKSQSQGIGTPSVFPPPPPPPPPADDDDEQGGGSGMPKTPQQQSLAKRTREESPRRGSGSQPAPLDGGSQPGSQLQAFTRLSLSALPYCTQACLLGLSRNGTLDPKCPNTCLHFRRRSKQHHPISGAQLCSLFQSQLAKDLDIGCECLDRYGMFGRVGVLFKITVPEYGYTLVAKGVQAGYADVLAKEAHIYSYCRNLQGIKIPVHLGNIDLARSYPTQSLAFVKHMMLMSWAGITLDDADVPDGVDISDEIDDTVGALYCAGVCHGDVRDQNLVWNKEVAGVMAIDFHMATTIAAKRPHESDSDEEREGKVPRLGVSLA